jgi:acyl carrier protein
MSTYPVNLEQLESVISERPEVADVLAMRRDQDHKLVAVIALQEYYSAPNLWQFVSERLGANCIPDTVVIVSALSYAEVGKLTKTTVARLMDCEDTLICNFTHPSTQTEELLTSLWQRVLDRQVVGAEDPFRELGGDSLSATLLLSLIEAELQVVVTLDRFLESSTIRAIAGIIDGLRADTQDTTLLLFWLAAPERGRHRRSRTPRSRWGTTSAAVAPTGYGPR